MIHLHAQPPLNLPEHPPLSGYGVVDSFPGLKFDQPVAILAPPGETNRLFVVERTGRIMVMADLQQPEKSVFLDLTGTVSLDGLEEGLLGMAFHPDYATNGRFFVYRTLITSSLAANLALHNQVSEFKVSTLNPNWADSASETVFISQLDGNRHHNAGDLKFGLDGYLYISLGSDQPLLDDVSENPHALDKGLFGGIIRIDVDKRLGNLEPRPHPAVSSHYLIPNDNPFIGVTTYQGAKIDPNKARLEYFAIGLRNPWRMSFHPDSGELIVGDVGNWWAEEINEIAAGGNYGWPYLQGNLPNIPIPAGFESIKPSITYLHGNQTNQGNCVIGGVYYFGAKIPQLNGSYVFGDYSKGHLWAAEYQSGALSDNPTWLTGTSPQVSCFGTDPRDGEVIMANFASGQILRLTYTPPESAPTFSEKLSQTGAFSNLAALTPVSDLIPYEINHAFWSDNALKRRWFYLPENTPPFVFSAAENWGLPAGAVWVKHFDLELTNGVAASRVRVETRFLVENETGGYGVTYRWNREQTEAFLVGSSGEDEVFAIHEDGNVRTQVWHYPTRAECMACHTRPGGFALGFNTLQLNREINIDGQIRNQLETLNENGYLDRLEADVNKLHALSALNDANRDLNERARSYLQANCSFCHQPETLKAFWDARYLTHSTEMGPLWQIHSRISATDATRMPPIGSNLHDKEGIALLSKWLNRSLPSNWAATDLGPVAREGSSLVEGDAMQVSGSGTGVTDASDALHFLHRTSSDNFTMVARLKRQVGRDPNGSSGILVRENLLPRASTAFIGLNQIGRPFFAARAVPDGAVQKVEQNTSGMEWVRLQKQGAEMSGWASSDSVSWTLIGTQSLSLPASFSLGLAACSGDSPQVNFAEFNQVTILSGGMKTPPPGSSWIAGRPVHLQAVASAVNSTVAQVEFYSGDRYLGEANDDLFFEWTNAIAGTHEIHSRIIDSLGQEVISEPVTYIIQSPASRALFAESESGFGGQWQGRIGMSGHAAPLNHQSLAPSVQFNVTEGTDAALPAYQDDDRALETPDGTARIATSWSGPRIKVTLELNDGLLHQLRMYFVDWHAIGLQQEIAIRSLDTGLELDRQTLREFEQGVHLKWIVRGRIEILISGIGAEAVLSGIFLDPHSNFSPAVTLSVQSEGGPAPRLPAQLILAATASDPDGTISKVEFFSHGALQFTDQEEPFVFSWTNALAGEHLFFARAVDNLGSVTDSLPLMLSPTVPISAAVFLGEDDQTQGDWVGTYGGKGYLLANHVTNFPSLLDFHPVGNSKNIWAYPGVEEKRALQFPDKSARIASSFYHPLRFSIETSFNDGRTHRLSLYALDWGQGSWQFKVRVLGSSGELLDERHVSNFSEGKYLTWSVRGKVQFEFTTLFGFSVISGVFLDEPPVGSPGIELIAPSNRSTFDAPLDLLLYANVGAANHPVQHVQFFANGAKIGSVLSEPYFLRWNTHYSNSVELIARVVDATGGVADSSPVTVNLVTTPTPAASVFQGVDSTNGGNWRDHYGKLGYSILAAGTNLPPSQSFLLTGHLDHVWTLATDEIRALEWLPDGLRTAPVWYADSAFEMRVGASDGAWHRLSLYCLDWDYGWREQRISILDASDRSLLDTRTVAGFFNGKYLTWNFRGDVIARIESIAGHAVVSGVFFDPVAPLDEWRLTHLANLPAEQAGWLDDEGDPDGDGILNLLEYKLGLDPMSPEELPALVAFTRDGAVRLGVKVNPAASDVEIEFQGSSDLVSWGPSTRVSFDLLEPGQIHDALEYEIIAPLRHSRFYRLKAARK